MTQRDRLIELLDTNCGYVDEVRADELADHLIENNVIVLPCKKGDTVWAKTSCFSKSLTETKVMFVWYNGLEYKIVCDGIGQLTLGKTVFLTKEAAEQALKGLNIE